LNDVLSKSILWPELLHPRTVTVDDLRCMSGAMHIQPKDAFNFQVQIKKLKWGLITKLICWQAFGHFMNLSR